MLGACILNPRVRYEFLLSVKKTILVWTPNKTSHSMNPNCSDWLYK